MKGKEEIGQKFKDYFSYVELVKKIPSHRFLAVVRGRQEGMLQLKIQVDPIYYERMIAAIFNIENLNRKSDPWLLETVRYTWHVKLFFSLELEIMSRLREKSEEEAIRVFAHNLRDLLMSAPAGTRATLGFIADLEQGLK